jgi:hypothetical protein
VCGGIGRHLGVDPVVVRLTAVALTFFGGAGVLLYLAAWILIPAEDEVPGAGPGEAPQPAGRAAVILGVLALLVVAGPILFAPALVTGGVLAVLAVLGVTGLAAAWLVTGRRPGRDAVSLAKAAVLGLGMLVLLSVLAAASFWTAGVGGGAFVAIAVVAAGLAIFVGAFLAPVRWLVLPALAIALPAGFVAAAGIDLDGGVGQRTHRPATLDELRDGYELGLGELTVDLRSLKLPRGDHRLRVGVGMGEAIVIVPDDVCVAADARIGVGAADVLERRSAGLDVDLVERRLARPGAPRLVVDADIGIGHLDVRHTDPPRWRERPPWRDRGRDAGAGRGGDTACAA